MQSTACSSTDVVAATFLDSASQEHVQEILPDRQPENTPEPERLPNIQTEDIGLWLGGDPVLVSPHLIYPLLQKDKGLLHPQILLRPKTGSSGWVAFLLYSQV